ncbi:MAG: putative nucleotide-diphospho-sugar transferase, partial [Pseudomonadota bacterium]
LDNDIISLCDATEMFALFEKADVIGVHDNNRNSKNALAQVGNTVPASFPSINSGVLGIKKTPATQRLLTAWWFRMRKNQHQVDQPALRSLLWERNIKLAILPIEYNLMAVKVIGILSRQMTAPRFLHLRQLNKNQRDVGDPMTPHDVADVLSLASCHRLLRALQNDNTIAPPFGVSARRGTRLFRRYLGWKDRLRSRLLFRWSFQRQASLARRKQKPPQRPCKDAGRKT